MTDAQMTETTYAQANPAFAPRPAEEFPPVDEQPHMEHHPSDDLGQPEESKTEPEEPAEEFPAVGTDVPSAVVDVPEVEPGPEAPAGQ
jgi:hypothetical protein